ncbi:MAG: N-acetylneuraminate synthase [Nitrosomonadaceae bacterium]|nr:N-acetylneuraminate synthase [Nitrosomonadaceae bacterium]|tara:strand:- start:41314 stop:42387 length:1074 start_codon:yes stop_codon:yes gene_type:complete
MNSKTFLVAEAGVNHNGREDLAFKLVDAAVDSGVDAIKFQTFKTNNLVTQNAEKANYQKKTTGSEENQSEMLQRLELPHELHHELVRYCKKKEIHFLSTAFDLESLDFLNNNLNLKTLKIPSGEITNGPLLLAHGRTGKKIILSTGMTTLDEIQMALSVIAYGIIGGLEPSIKNFQSAFNSDLGQTLLKEKVTLLHCTTEYPAPFSEINLRAMQSMKKSFALPVGYSDHSEGTAVAIAAVALGAILIEKHFTLDKTLPGPDHKTSLEPDEIKGMVKEIRAIEKALGNGEKGPQPSELGNRKIVRKSLVATQNIRKGDKFTTENISVKRPGTGKNPMEYWEVLGEVSLQSYDADEVIT